MPMFFNKPVTCFIIGDSVLEEEQDEIMDGVDLCEALMGLEDEGQ